MAYTRTTWQEQITQVNATNMNNIESGTDEMKCNCVFKASTAAFTLSSSLTPIEFGTDVVTSSKITHDTATNKDQIIFNESGVYWINAKVQGAGSSTVESVKTEVFLNSTQLTNVENKTSYYAYCNLSGVVQATAGDILRIKGSQASSISVSANVDLFKIGESTTYSKTTWANNTTEITGKLLNNIENGIEKGKICAVASVSMSATQSIGTTYSNFLFDRNDIASSVITHDTATNKDRIVCTEAGYYLVTANVKFDSGTSRDYHYVSINKNSTSVSTYFLLDGSEYSKCCTALVDMAAGDYITISATIDTGTNSDVIATASVIKIQSSTYSAYSKTTWANGTTQLNATNLNHVENGVVSQSSYQHIAKASRTAIQTLPSGTEVDLTLTTDNITDTVITHAANSSNMVLTQAGTYLVVGYMNVAMDGLSISYVPGAVATLKQNSNIILTEAYLPHHYTGYSTYYFCSETISMCTIVNAAANDIIKLTGYQYNYGANSGTQTGSITVIKLT